MATTTTMTNTQVLPPTAPTVAAVAHDTTALDENEIFEEESSSMPLGRSPARSVLTRMWEAVDESSSANNEYASLVQRGESEEAAGAFPTFPVSSLTSTLRVTAYDELIF
ncbi:hypothetical protein GSI_10475 [Ganoderma sinense ZZ0214-1]|uniref:Uncharacterized protein n=1 Tax=Ganoderma sinense ZZ0214-1 TaxID=1077348 RepID=A0A2G8S197_9APHY|nr:hypothetical protein GSI_10475 [Ganoderma sinense ZZ0214-1]